MKTATENGKLNQQYIIGQNHLENINEFINLGADIHTQIQIS